MEGDREVRTDAGLGEHRSSLGVRAQAELDGYGYGVGRCRAPLRRPGGPTRAASSKSKRHRSLEYVRNGRSIEARAEGCWLRWEQLARHSLQLRLCGLWRAAEPQWRSTGVSARAAGSPTVDLPADRGRTGVASTAGARGCCDGRARRHCDKRQPELGGYERQAATSLLRSVEPERWCSPNSRERRGYQ